MPDCPQCEWFRDGDLPYCELAKIGPWTDWHTLDAGQRKMVLRSCKAAIGRRLKSQLAGQVLEVGPGVRNMRRLVSETGATWHGLEPRWKNAELRISQGTVGNMPYQDDTFDWVLCMECVEHWHEYNDTLTGGLAEINRVLKPGGTLVMTCPFHFHGHEWFFEGQVDDVKDLFFNGDWGPIRFEPWRLNYDPLPRVEPFRDVRGWEEMAQRHGQVSAWRLEVQASKTEVRRIEPK